MAAGWHCTRRRVAPTIGTDAFAGTAPGFTIYAVEGNATWGTVPGVWNGYPTQIWPVYTITPATAVHRQVTASGPATGLAGFDTTFTVTPDAGYHTADVTVDGTSVGAIATCAFKNIQAPHNIAATFADSVVSTTTRLSGSSSVKKNRSLKLNGTVSPGGPGRVTITMKRKVGAKWKSAGSVRVTVIRGAYQCTVKLKFKGGWRMVATYSGGATGPTTYRSSHSGTKSVRVK
jgi:hypothetical protein